MLTIKKPVELAHEIMRGGDSGFLETEEGTLCFYKKFEKSCRIIYEDTNNTEIDDVINAYEDALIYELERLSDCNWYIR